MEKILRYTLLLLLLANGMLAISADAHTLARRKRTLEHQEQLAINTDVYTLAGCKFQSYDIHLVKLDFYDSTHCVCTQKIQLNLPNDNNSTKQDTLEYRIEGSNVIFINPRLSSEQNTEYKKITDYYSMLFHFSRYVVRDSTVLKNYPITITSPISFKITSCVADQAYWICWGYETIGRSDFQDVLFIRGTVCHLIEGTPKIVPHLKKEDLPQFECECKGLEFPCYDVILYKKGPEYCWFTRARASILTDSTKNAITHRRFICNFDTLCFENDTLCRAYTKSDQQKHFYRVDGANVLVYGMDPSRPTSADTLIYHDKVLYHACVEQKQAYPDADPPHSPKIRIGPNIPAEYRHPTAFMQTRAFVCENEHVTDEQIGTTFQHIYMPINFHYAVPPLTENSKIVQ